MMQNILAAAVALSLATAGSPADHAILNSALGPSHPAYLESGDASAPATGPNDVTALRVPVSASGFAGERCESRVAISGMRVPTGKVVDWRAVTKISLERRDGMPAVVIYGGIPAFQRMAVKLGRNEDGTRILLAMERLQVACRAATQP